MPERDEQDQTDQTPEASERKQDGDVEDAGAIAGESIDSAENAARELGDAEPDAELEGAAEAALKTAQGVAGELEERSAAGEPDGDAPYTPPDLTGGTGNGAASGVDLLSDVNLHVKIELGRTRMYVEDVLKLNEGAVVELDKAAGDPVDIYVNDRHVARGEVLVINDCFCVRVSEIIASVGSDP